LWKLFIALIRGNYYLENKTKTDAMECIKRLYKEILKDSALPFLTKILTVTSWPCLTCGKTCGHRKVYEFSE
jgi:hypothetical protein